jgi:hypothetical protein
MSIAKSITRSLPKAAIPSAGGEKVFKHNNLNDPGVGLPYRKDAGDPSPARANPCFY